MGGSSTKHASGGQKISEAAEVKKQPPDRMDLIVEDACIALHLRVKQKVTKMSNLPTAVRDKHISVFLENLTSSKEFFQWELYQALRSRLTIKYWVRLNHRVFEDSQESLDVTVRHMNRPELSAVVEIRKAPVNDRLTLKKDLGRLSYLIAHGKAERGYLIVYGTYPKGFQPPVLMIDKETLKPVAKTVSVQTYSDDYLERAKVTVTEGADWSKVAERETVAAGVAKFSMDLPGVVKLQPEKFRIRVYRLESRPRDDNVDGHDDDDVTNPYEDVEEEDAPSTSRSVDPQGSDDVTDDVTSTPPRLESPEGPDSTTDDATPTSRSLESPEGLENKVPTMSFTAEERLEFKKVGLDLSPRKQDLSPRKGNDSHETEKTESEETLESGLETLAAEETHM